MCASWSTTSMPCTAALARSARPSCGRSTIGTTGYATSSSPIPMATACGSPHFSERDDGKERTMTMTTERQATVRVCSFEELEREGRKVVPVDGRIVLVLLEKGQGFALDNRCPHMGFPLHRGT